MNVQYGSGCTTWKSYGGVPGYFLLGLAAAAIVVAAFV
jgi:hypothetical protein